MRSRTSCATTACIATALLPAAAHGQSGTDPFGPAQTPEKHETSAAAKDSERSIAEDPRIHLRGAGWFSRLDGNLSVGNTIPGTINDVNLIDTLDFDPSRIVGMGSVTVDLGKDQRIHLSLGYTGRFKYDGTSDPLNISFDNLHFTGVVRSDARLDIAEVGVTFDVARPGPVTLSLGSGTRIFFFDGSVTGTASDPHTGVTALRTSSANAVAPIPGLSGSLRWDITGQLYIRGAAEGIWLGSYGDFFDASAEVGFDFTPNIGVFGGYRWMRADTDVSDVNFDVTIRGPYAGLEVRF